MDYMTKPLQSGIVAVTAKSALSAAGQAANLPPSCFFIGKICEIPDESGKCEGTAFSLFSTVRTGRSAPYP